MGQEVERDRLSPPLSFYLVHVYLFCCDFTPGFVRLKFVCCPCFSARTNPFVPRFCMAQGYRQQSTSLFSTTSFLSTPSLCTFDVTIRILYLIFRKHGKVGATTDSVLQWCFCSAPSYRYKDRIWVGWGPKWEWERRTKRRRWRWCRRGTKEGRRRTSIVLDIFSVLTQ